MSSQLCINSDSTAPTGEPIRQELESSLKRFSDLKQQLKDLHNLLIHPTNKQPSNVTNTLSFTTNCTFSTSIEKKCQSAMDTITEMISQLNWMLRHTSRLFESGLCEANTTNFANSAIQIVRELHQKLYILYLARMGGDRVFIW